ncbi:MAG: helix-turn-helix domain-containing protein [Bacteroidia bacterium]|nr:helix-turn-helix domain-containing protein [Bacteroidia bacterium]
MQLFSNFVKAKNSMGEFILIPQKKFEELEQKVDLLIQLGKEAGKVVKLNDWISEQEAQKLLGLKETSMWALRKKKRVVSSKIGGKIFYSLRSIEKLLDKNQI